MALLDNFTDVGGTALTAHTADSGHSWTLHPSAPYSGSMSIIAAGNLVRATATGVQNLHYSSFSATDMTVTGAIVMPNATPSAGTNSFARLAVRLAPAADTYYFVSFSSNFGATGTPELTLFRRVAGANTQLAVYSSFAGTASSTWPGTWNVELDATGSGATVALVVKLNGTTVLTFNDTNAARITTAGRAGFQLEPQGAPTDSSGVQLNSITATDLLASTATAAPFQRPSRRFHHMLVR